MSRAFQTDLFTLDATKDTHCEVQVSRAAPETPESDADRRAAMSSVADMDGTSCQVTSTVDSRDLLLAIGYISHPKFASRRTWIRRAAGRFTTEPTTVVSRFVLGCLLDRATMDEASSYGDVVTVRAPDSSTAACVEKSFAWWRIAVTLFPNAKFVGKTDDDSFNHLSNWVDLLRANTHDASLPLIYGGWGQFSSYLPEHNTPCGWAAGPGAALAAARRAFAKAGGASTNCAFCTNHPFCYDRRGKSSEARLNATVVGPYLFAAGPFELMSAPLARLVFDSNVTRSLAAMARGGGMGPTAAASRRPRTKYNQQGRMWQPWSCRSEDAFVGLAVFLSTTMAQADVATAEPRAQRPQTPCVQCAVLHHGSRRTVCVPQVDFWSLGLVPRLSWGQIVDAHEGLVARPPDFVDQLLTVHKLEMARAPEPRADHSSQCTCPCAFGYRAQAVHSAPPMPLHCARACHRSARSSTTTRAARSSPTAARGRGSRGFATTAARDGATATRPSARRDAPRCCCCCRGSRPCAGPLRPRAAPRR